MKISKPVRAFLAGSSFPVIFWPFSLLAIGFLNAGEKPFDFEFVVWVFPFILGSLNVLFWQVQDKIPLKSHTHKLWAAGLLTGLCFPILGGQLNVPHLLFGFPADQQFLIIPLGMLFYGCIWRFAIGFMNEVVGLK